MYIPRSDKIGKILSKYYHHNAMQCIHKNKCQFYMSKRIILLACDDDDMANEEVECPSFAKILDNKLLFLM